MNANELRDRMRSLPEPPADSKPPYWDYWRHDLWQRVVDGEDPFGFPTWPCIYHTMLVNHWKKYIRFEFGELLTSLVYREREGSGRRIRATEIERHKDHVVGRQLGNTPYSLNFIHQAYHLHRWEEITGNHIEDCKKIIEFGGGYGAMAFVIHRLGFKGEYHIYDLPEFSLLQEFYLTNCRIDNIQYNNHQAQEPADLLIACHSLSETDMEHRTRFLANHKADSYLFLYHTLFAEYDNLAYFQTDVPILLPDHQWEHLPISHMPPGSWYSFGWEE